MGRPLAEQPELPSFERLHEMLSYDVETGMLTWKERDVSSFEGAEMPAHIMAKSWKSRFAGKQAGGFGGGYHRVMIDGKHQLSHRVIWKMVKGEDPIFVDHIDGNRLNNRIENLRNVTHAVNMKNKSLYRNNKSGVPGVEYHKRDKVWAVKVGVNGKQVHLGSFKSFEEALAGRICANVLLEYDANHGRIDFGVN